LSLRKAEEAPQGQRKFSENKRLQCMRQDSQFAGNVHSCLYSGEWKRYKVDLVDKNKQTISVAGGKPK